HFYVMYEYLCALGYQSKGIDPFSHRVLDLTLNTPSLAHKLLGMQMMIETTALTIFAAVRELNVEPVLSELLTYYEKDEARHVGLGIQYLPSLLRRMSIPEGIQTLGFQLRLIFWELASLKAMEPHLKVIGIPARQVLQKGKAMQLSAFEELWSQPGAK